MNRKDMAVATAVGVSAVAVLALVAGGMWVATQNAPPAPTGNPTGSFVSATPSATATTSTPTGTTTKAGTPTVSGSGTPMTMDAADGLPKGWVPASDTTDSNKLIYGRVVGKGPTSSLQDDALDASNVAMASEAFMRAFNDPKKNAKALQAASDPTFYASILAADTIALPAGKLTVQTVSGPSSEPDPLTGSPYVDASVTINADGTETPAYKVRMEWFGNDHDGTGIGVWRAVALDYASEALTSQKIPPLGVSLRDYVAELAAGSVKQIISRAPNEDRESWGKRVALYLSAPKNALASFNPPTDAPTDTIQAYDRASLMFVTPAGSKDIYVYVSTWYAPSKSPDAATGAEFIVQMSNQFNTFAPADAFTIEQWNTAHPDVAIGDEQ